MGGMATELTSKMLQQLRLAQDLLTANTRLPVCWAERCWNVKRKQRLFVYCFLQSVSQTVTTDNLLSGLGDIRGKFHLWGRHGFVSGGVGLHPSLLSHSRKCCYRV